MICPRCNGEQYIDYTCKACNGSGEGIADGTRCQICPGSMGIIKDKCDLCAGKGWTLGKAIPIQLQKESERWKESMYLNIEQIDSNEIILSVEDNDHEATDQIILTFEEIKKMIIELNKLM